MKKQKLAQTLKSQYSCGLEMELISGFEPLTSSLPKLRLVYYINLFNIT